MAIQHPATLDQRLVEAGKLVDRARRLDDTPMETYAQLWRCLAALEVGDRPDADVAADEALRLVDKFGHPAIQTFITSMEVARELLWGDLDRAEQVAERYRALGHRVQVGGVDSLYSDGTQRDVEGWVERESRLKCARQEGLTCPQLSESHNAVQRPRRRGRKHGPCRVGPRRA